MTRADQGLQPDSSLKGRYLTVGPPGTGKTTWLGSQVRAIIKRQQISDLFRYPEPVLICSLTRTAAAEVAGRDLPIGKHMIGTLHAHCYRALDRPAVAAGKILAEWNREHPNYMLSEGVARSDLDDLSMDSPAYEQAGDELMEDYQLMRNRLVPRTSWSQQLKEFASVWEEWKQVNDLRDFTDLIEDCLRFEIAPPGDPRVIMVDEAQDLSAMEHELFLAWGQMVEATIAVGDPWQSLYEWRGAHPQLFSDPDVPESHRRVLRQSFRVPRKVLVLAQLWAKRLSSWQSIEYKPRREEPTDPDSDFIEGDLSISPATWKQPQPLARRILHYLEEGRTIMVCASCGYMLGPVIRLLRETGIPIANPWRACHGAWNPLSSSGISMADRIVALLRADPVTFGEESFPWHNEVLWKWVKVMRASGLLNYGCKKQVEIAAETSPDLIGDWSEWFTDGGAFTELVKIMNDKDRTDVGEIIGWMRQQVMATAQPALDYPLKVLSSRGVEPLVEAGTWYKQPSSMAGQGVLVGSIHSFKGAEADVVFAFPDLSGAAYREWIHAGPSQDSVIRTFYVAITRARERFVACTPCGQLSVDLQHAAIEAGKLAEERSTA